MASTPLTIAKPAVKPRRRLARWLSFPVAIGFTLFVVTFSLGGLRIAESDLWWHLANANHIVTTHSLPRVDQYSYTAAGSPWIDHEWLSEMLYYAAFRGFGLRGIVLLFLVVTFVIFASLSYLAFREGANPKTAAVFGLLGIVLGSVSLGPRMLLFGWLCMVALLFILQNHSQGRTRWLWAIPPLFALWINLHGSWLFGAVVLGLYVASGTMQGDWGIITAERFSRAEFKRLALAIGLAAGALFVNPFGYKLVFYPFDLMFRQQSNINNIDEWRSVDFHEQRGKLVLLLLLTILAVALISKRRWKLREVLLGAFALYASLSYMRMLFFAALIFIPILATRIPLFPPYQEEKEKPLLNALMIAGVLAFVIWRFPTEAALRDKVNETFPEAALGYMLQHGITDRVFNDYGFGGYMIWRAPQIKTFIDGRADLFVYNGVFDDYLKIVRLDGTLEVLDRYRINYALFQKGNPAAYVVAHSPCWKEIYTDGKLASLYERTRDQTGCVAPQ